MKVYVMVSSWNNNEDYEFNENNYDTFLGVYKSWDDVYDSLRRYISEVDCDQDDPAACEVYHEPELIDESDETHQNARIYLVAKLFYNNSYSNYTDDSLFVYEIEM